MKKNLRDAYSEYKDLTNRCMIDMSSVEKNDRRIFYFKPESILLKEMDAQRQYRDQVQQTLSGQNIRIAQQSTMSEELIKEVTESIADQSEPDQVRVMLADFYERRAYNLQHKKYKVLLRWAHFALTSEYLERIGHHGTFTYGRLQYELENSIKRYERLSQDDDYEALRDGEIKKPKVKGEKDPDGEEFKNGLYTESGRKDPLSCLRMDDFEIYLRSSTYELKLFRTVEKFIARLKWLPLAKGIDLFKESHVRLLENRQELFLQDKIREKAVRERFSSSVMKKTDDLIIQMEEILAASFQCNFTEKDHFKLRAPVRIQNIVQLQADILQRASSFKIFGDIEIDDGHSFIYQVHIFFTLYFQRQIIKSQFSIYDQTVRDMKDAYDANEPPDDEVGDINEIERRNLNSLLLIDFHMVDMMNSNSDNNNLHLIKKGRQVVDQIHELKKNFTDITLVRLMKSAQWLKYVKLHPEVSEQEVKQNAIFNQDYTPDLLLESIQEFIDVNDIATVNTVYSDLTQMYGSLNNRDAKDNQTLIGEFERVADSTLITGDASSQMLLNRFAEALKIHLTQNAHQEGGKPKSQSIAQKKNSILKIIPLHLMQAQHTLRHMRIRDVKTKLLYVLNFFRAIQKRIALDLREFAGHEVISGDTDIKVPYEATYIGSTNQKVLSNNLQFSNMNAAKTVADMEFSELMKKDKKEEEEEEGVSEKINLIDLKKYKYKYKFNQQVNSTCPIVPAFHARYGEPLDDKNIKPDLSSDKSTTKVHITQRSKVLLARMDNFTVKEDTKEIFVIDDYGMHIMFDCALGDMATLDTELLRIATYYLRKNEGEFEIRSQTFPLADRFQIMEDIYEGEFDYQYLKAQLMMAYLEAYEHICDPLEQQRMMQIMVNLIAERPRFDYCHSAYFTESYHAENRCMQAKLRLIREVIDQQMIQERKDNKHIKNYLQMAFKVTNDFTSKQWNDSNQEDVLRDVKERQIIQGGMRFQDIQNMQEQLKVEKDQPIPEKGAAAHDKFAEMLGLDDAEVDKMVQNAQSNETVDDMMAEDSNFIKTQEGYPFFLREQQASIPGQQVPENSKESHYSFHDILSRVKFSNFSHEVGILDFYESLTIIPKFCSALKIMFQEVESICLPGHNLSRIALQTVYFEKCYVEFKKSAAFMNDELIEYEGSQFVENDLIMSSPDKMMFLVKDMISQLARIYKKNLNPFFIAKLDLFTINYFPFPDMPKSVMLNKNSKRLDVNFSRNFIETQLRSGGAQERFFPKLREDDRRVNVPPMLLVLCNLVEVQRLRESLISALSESCVLREIYDTLKEMVNRGNLKVSFQTPIQYQQVDGFMRDQINFFEEGSLTDQSVDFAINEMDPSMRANLNFMNSESFQCLVLDGGLQDLRAVLHYQLMQKQLLMVASRLNSSLMQSHRRALAEIELFQDHRIRVEGNITNYDLLYKQMLGTNDWRVDEELVQQHRNRVAHHLATQCEQDFVSILPIKDFIRGRVEKKQRDNLHLLQQMITHKLDSRDPKQDWPLLPQTVARLNHDYKVSLVHYYCAKIIKSNIINALKYQAIESTSHLRTLMNIFPSDMQILSLQSNIFKDYLFQSSHFSSDLHTLEEGASIFSNIEENLLLKLTLIPSVKSLLSTDTMTFADKAIFDKSAFDSLPSFEFVTKHLLKNHFEKVDLKRRMRLLNQEVCTFLSDAPSAGSQHTVHGRLSTYYGYLLNIFQFHFFNAKLSISQVEGLMIELCATANLQYWTEDDESEGRLLMSVASEDKKLSELIIKKFVQERRKKQMVLDEVQILARNLRQFFEQLASHASPLQTQQIDLIKANEFLSRYNNLTQTRLVCGLLSTLKSSYTNLKGPQVIGNLIHALKQLLNLDLSAPFFAESGVIMHQTLLGEDNRALAIRIKKDQSHFKRTIIGLKNDKELVDPSLMLVQELFIEALRAQSSANFGGQVKTYSHIKWLTLFVLGMDKTGMTYFDTIQRQLDQTVSDIVVVENSLMTSEMQLKYEGLGRRLVNMQIITQSLMLHFSAVTLINRCTLTTDASKFNDSQLSAYQRDIGWKIEHEYQKKLSKELMKDKQSSSTNQTKLLAAQLTDARVGKAARDFLDDSIQSEFQHQERKKQQTRQVQLQQTKLNKIMTKAIIKISCREFEVRLIKMAYDAIKVQTDAISKALEMASYKIDQNIDKWQNLAPTLSDYHEKRWQHLDPLNRFSWMQAWLTKLKNRGLDIETLTSGPGVVFNYKDLNECLQAFCVQVITFNEKEIRTRTHGFHQIINHLKHLLYIKDTRVDGLKQKLRMVQDNITRIVNSKIYEKGNALIFELDRGLREVIFYKEHIHEFEREMKEQVNEEHRHTIMQKDLQIDLSRKQTYDMIHQLISEFKALSTQQEIENTEKIRLAKEKCIFDSVNRLKAYAQGTLEKKEQTPDKQEGPSTGFADERVNKRLLKAQQDVIKYQRLIKEQRTLWMFKTQALKIKYRDEIFILQNKLTSNQVLWQQLAESDKRTKILQQELIFTQKSLSQCEKIIEKLKEELKLSEQERMRLFQYKQNKSQRLSELEEQVKKIDISDHINISKVIEQLRQKDKELTHLKAVERNFTQHTQKIEQLNSKSDQLWQRKYFQEVELKNQAVQKLGQLQDEMRQLEQGHFNASLSLKEVESYDWKQKCKEMFDICKGLTEENADLLEKIKMLKNDAKQDRGSANLVSVHGKLKGNHNRTTRNQIDSLKQLDTDRLSWKTKDHTNNIYSNSYQLPDIKRDHHSSSSGAYLDARVGQSSSMQQNLLTSTERQQESPFVNDSDVNREKQSMDGNSFQGYGSSIQDTAGFLSNIQPIKPILPAQTNFESIQKRKSLLRAQNLVAERQRLNQYTISKSTSHYDLYNDSDSQPTVSQTNAYTNMIGEQTRQVSQNHSAYNDLANKTMKSTGGMIVKGIGRNGGVQQQRTAEKVLNRDMSATIYKDKSLIKSPFGFDHQSEVRLLSDPRQQQYLRNDFQLRGNSKMI